MTIFSRSIVKEYSVTWAVIFAALLLVVFVTQLVRYLGYAANGSVPFGSVFLLLTLGSIKNLPILFSLSIILAVTLSLSRWYRDSEMVVWASSGKALSAWVSPTLWFVTPIAILVAILSLFLAPWAEQRLEIEKKRLQAEESERELQKVQADKIKHLRMLLADTITAFDQLKKTHPIS